MPEQSFDGDWIIDVLSKRKDTRTASYKLKRIRALHSVKIDLDFAHDALNQLLDTHRIPDDNIPKNVAVIDRALTMLLIIYYTRSTEVSPSRGSGFDPTRFYNEEQKDLHRGVVSLRNQAVAHYGSGSHPGGEWSSDKLTLIHDPLDGSLRFGHEYTRTNFRGRVLQEINDLLATAKDGLMQDIEKAETAGFAALEQLDAKLADLLANCPRKPHVDGTRYYYAARSDSY